MNKKILRIFRFFQIDLEYLFFTPQAFILKIKNIFLTDLYLFYNLLFKKTKFPQILFNNMHIKYDTPYATKTFLAAIKDFYIETNRLSIFGNRPIILDIGSNIGQFLFAIKTFLPDSKVYSLEPDPEIYKILKYNSRKFKNVLVQNFALSDRSGKLRFYISNNFSEWSSLIKQESDSRAIDVIGIRGDELFKKLSIIDLIKVDVEGAELEVIKGLLNTLKKSKYLLIEVSLSRNKNNLGSSNLFALLFENGFYIFSIGRIFSEGIGRDQGAVDILFKNRKYN